MRWLAAEERTGRRAAAMGVLLFALVAGLAAAAAGAYALEYELYGRFLVGWYVLLLIPAWSTAALTTWPWWLWYAAPLAAHAYAMQLILLRYF
ncbi:MAG: hypothetical protein R2712_27280 [Vicinamibacterales bacterium]